eukprot:UN10105
MSYNYSLFNSHNFQHILQQHYQQQQQQQIDNNNNDNVATPQPEHESNNDSNKNNNKSPNIPLTNDILKVLYRMLILFNIHINLHFYTTQQQKLVSNTI